MSTKTKKTNTIYGVPALDDKKNKSLKANCTTNQLAEEHYNQSKTINNEKETPEYKGTSYNYGCLEGFFYGHHDD